MEKAVTGGKPPVLVKHVKNNYNARVVKQAMHASIGIILIALVMVQIHFFLHGSQRFLTFDGMILTFNSLTFSQS